MKIKRDYSQPFFRQPKRHPIRNLLIASILGVLLGLAILSQWDLVEQTVDSLAGSPPTPTPLPSELATRAAILTQASDFNEAEKLLARAVAQRPRNSAYLYEYGRVLIELGRYDEAQELGESITEIDARDARGFALKGAALTWQGQGAVAIPILLSGLEVNPRLTALYAALARAYADTERWADALETGERGLSINADDAELIRSYAYALQAVGSYNDAINYLQRAIELRPSYLPAQFELAGLFLSRDEDQEAIDLYNRILSIDPRQARAMLRLCQAYLKVGEFARALGFCEDSVAEDGSDPQAQYQLGLLYYSELQFERAQGTFQQCLDYDDGRFNLSCRYRLGLSHYYTGNCTRAWALLRESLDLTAAGADETTIGNILQGLDAINSDPKCIDEAAAPQPFQD